MKRRTLLASFAFGLAFIAVGGCGKGKQEGAAKVINVAVSPASPPNLFEENGQTKGLDYDLFDGYCKARGCTMNITAYDWQGMLGAVVSKKADVAFSALPIARDPSRLLRVAARDGRRRHARASTALLSHRSARTAPGTVAACR